MSLAGSDASCTLLNNYEWLPCINGVPISRWTLAADGLVTQFGSNGGDVGFICGPQFGNEAWNALQWEGALFSLFEGPKGGAWSSYRQILSGNASAIERDGGQCKFTLWGPEATLNRSLLNTSYAGTGNAEGPVDLKGTLKPVAFGTCRNTTPILLDPVNWIFQFHDGIAQDVTGVFEMGMSLGPAVSTASTFASLKAATLQPGEWLKAPAIGMFRLGAEPISVDAITCDIQGAKDGSAYPSTIATIVPALLKRIGVPAGKINQTSFNAFSGDAWDYSTKSQIEVGELAREALRQAGGHLFADGTGTWRVSKYLGTSSPTALRQDRSTFPQVRSITQPEAKAPVHKVRVGFNRNYTVQDTSSLSPLLTENQDDIIAAQEAADAAKAAAEAAQADADQLRDEMDAIAADGILDRAEKARVVLEFQQITGEKPGIESRAGAMLPAITTLLTAYSAAYNTLSSYLTGLTPAYTDTTQNTPIVRTTWNSRWVGYTNARQALLNEIARIAADYVGGTPANTVAAATTNFNTRNDRNGAAISAPTFPSDVLSNSTNTDGSANITFKWNWGGVEDDIDGFRIVVRSSTSSSAYNLGTAAGEELEHFVAADRRAFQLLGIAANRYYTLYVQAYRDVDQDVAAGGRISSTAVKSTATGNNPYRPSSTVVFGGNVTGSVGGTPANTLVADLAAALTNISAAQTQIDDLFDTYGESANAAASAQAAANSATTAQAAATTANTAKTNAETARDQAQTATTAANTARDNAQTYANAASLSATASDTAKSAAQTAKTAAETANTNAQTAKTAAETAFSNSTTAKDAAVAAKSAAELARDNAQTKASEASGSATAAAGSAATATTKASEAGNSATAAAASAVSSSSSYDAAAVQLAAQFPPYVDPSLAQFTLNGTGAPSDTVPLNSFTSIAGVGWGYQGTSPVLMTRGVVPVGQGRIYETSASFVWVSGSATSVQFRVFYLDANYVQVGSTVTSFQGSTGTDGLIKTFARTWTDTNAPAGAVWARFGAARNSGGGTFAITSLSVADVTAREAAAGSATAAATSASAASTSAGAAGTSATSATTSANTASTKAGEASSSASSAATSASDALGSKNAAQTSATLAAGSATAAGNSATAANTSAGTAATQATNASNSASAANTSAINAATSFAATQNALYVSNPLLISSFDEGATHWTSSRTGSPTSAPAAPGTLVNDPDLGTAIEISTWTVLGTNILSRGVMPITAGRIYEITAKFKVMSGDGSVGFNLAMGTMKADYTAAAANVITGVTSTITSTGVVETLTNKFSLTGGAGIATIPVGTTQGRVGLRLNTTESGLVIRIGSIIVTDVTEREAAAASASSASVSASSAATSASTATGAASTATTQAGLAAGSATSAGNSATAANSSAGTATTQANAAGNSASAANTSANNAASSYNSASLQAAALFPERPDATLAQFTGSTAGDPAALTPLTAVNFATIPGWGLGRTGTSTNLIARYVVPASAGTIYEVTTTVFSLDGVSTQMRARAEALDANYASLGTVTHSNSFGTGTTTNAPVVATRLFDNSLYPTGTVWLRFFINRSSAGGNFGIGSLAIKDVTVREAAVGSATAAATSATTASTAATNAGQSANSASTSANTASTKAGEATTSASSAASSASDALGYRNTASTHATNAATSATNAGNQATAASGSASNASTSANSAGNSATAANSSAVAAASSYNASAVQAAALFPPSVDPALAQFTSDTNGAAAATTILSDFVNIAGVGWVRQGTSPVINTRGLLPVGLGRIYEVVTGAVWVSGSSTNMKQLGAYLDANYNLISTLDKVTGGTGTSGSVVRQTRLWTDADAPAGAVYLRLSSRRQSAGGTFGLVDLSVTDVSAREAAASSATAAAGSAATAGTSATAAGVSATAAQASATTASTQATNASNAAGAALASQNAAATSASGAATSATNAGNFASSAQTASTSANLTAAYTMPSDFQQDGQYWFRGWEGVPSAVTPIVANSTFAFPTVSGVGKVIQITGTAQVDVGHIGTIKLTPGRTYRYSVKARQTAGTAGQQYQVYRIGTTDAGSSVGNGNWTTVTMSSLNTWYEVGGGDISSDIMIAAGATGLRGLFRTLSTAGSTTVQLAYFRIEDVTSQLAAEGSASAAANSASSAASSQTAAGTSASAAQGSATNAATQAGNASTSASQASTSATNAQASANTASTQATNAANSATSAGNSASAASGSASTASTQASNAGNSATSAAASAVSASSTFTNFQQSVMNQSQALPYDFSDGLTYWTDARNGAPAAVTAAPGTIITNDSYFGLCNSITNWTTAGMNILTRGVLPAQDGRFYEVRARCRVAGSDGSVNLNIVCSEMNSSYAGTASNYRGGPSQTVLVDTPVEIVGLFSDSTANGATSWTSSAVNLRFGLRLNSAESGLILRVQSIKITDVTDRIAAANSAAAASTSASNASTSATAAGNSATAANGSATTASTQAGNASSSASAANTSATNANSSAGSAAGSANAAANSATSASGFANTAQTKAGEAASSASAANNSAAAADASASSASTSASNASTFKGQAETAASTASTQATVATNAAAAASSSMTITSQIAAASINANPVFADWPAGQTHPTNYTAWAGSPIIVKATGAQSPYAYRIGMSSSTATSLGVKTPQMISAQVLSQNLWVVLEVDAQRNSGTLPGAGVLFRAVTSAGAVAQDMYIPLNTLADTAGVTGAGGTNTIRRWRLLSQITASNAYGYEICLMHRYNGISGYTSSATANDITYHKVAIRPATDQEIATKQAVADLSTLSATVNTQGQTLSTLNTNYASLSSTVSTQGVTINNHTSAISTTQNNVTTLFGRAALTLDVGGNISGYEINNNGSTSQFKVKADQFELVPSSSSGNRVAYSDGTFRIYAGATMTVWGAAFGSSGQFIEWTGPTQSSLSGCTESNAIKFVKTNGQAYYAGGIIAGTLKTSVSNASLGTSATVTSGLIGSNGNTVNVNASYSFTATLTAQYAATSTGVTNYNNAISAFGPVSGDGTYDNHTGTKANNPAAGTFTMNLKRDSSTIASLTSVTGALDLEGIRPVPVDNAPGWINYTYTFWGSVTTSDPTVNTANRTYSADFTRSFPYGSATIQSQRISVTSTEW